MQEMSYDDGSRAHAKLALWDSLPELIALVEYTEAAHSHSGGGGGYPFGTAQRLLSELSEKL